MNSTYQFENNLEITAEESLPTRISTSNLIKEKRRAEGAIWGLSDGVLLGLTTADQGKDFNGLMGDPNYISSVEKVIINNIHDLLRETNKRPIVIIDFGGGVGLSMLKIASLFETEVLKGEIVFIVTNLELEEPDINNLSQYGVQSNCYDLYRELFNKKLVKFIMADAEELERKTISVNGKTYNLVNNVDLVVESSALIHSIIPELDFMRIGRILGNYGTLMFSSSSPQESKQNANFYPILTKIFLLAIEQSRQYNSLVENSRQGQLFRIFQKVSAPRIQSDT